ncbi:MAG: NAD(+) synthase [Bacteroidales bacterium]|nr:NAD(+) synthase [Bacteroidales bacterium]
MKNKPFSKNILHIDNIEQLADRIASRLRDDIAHRLNRFGGVIGLSGGIDSSVTLALTVKALGANKVLGIMMPEKDSSPDSLELATTLAKQFGVSTLTEVITGALDGFGCYERRDRAVKEVIPEYDPATYKMKIGIRQSGIGSHLPPVFQLTVVRPDGTEISERLPSKQLRTIIAASNFKQRSRASFLYYHAERLHYAVVGTPNKHEVAEGFFVKHGDGAADVMPIGDLYKTQVYQLAEFLNIPEEIRRRTPTTDTYSAEQTQEEFFYQFPYHTLDLLWYGFENNCDPAEVGQVMKLPAEEIKLIWKNFERKIATTEYLRMEPIRNYNFI